MHPGPLLRQIRLSKKMTLQKASKNVVTVSALAKFERGETNLAVDSFLEILKNLHISLHQFSFFYEQQELTQTHAFWQAFEKHDLSRKQLDFCATNNRISFKSQLKTVYYAEQSTPEDFERLNDFFYYIDFWTLNELKLLAYSYPWLNSPVLKHCSRHLFILSLETVDFEYLWALYDALLGLYSRLLLEKEYLILHNELPLLLQQIPIKDSWHRHWFEFLFELNELYLSHQENLVIAKLTQTLNSSLEPLPPCITAFIYTQLN